MTSFVSTVIEFISAHPHLAYLVVLLLAASESIPVLGALVPGSAVIVAASALVPTGAVRLWPLLVAAVAGAIIGDGLSYWIGHRYKGAALDFRPLRRYPALVARSEAFFERHGPKSVFLARFIPGLRAVIPLFAGILQMPPLRFYAANILSALTWGPAHVLLGVLVGASFNLFGAAAKPLGILLILLAVLIWSTVRIVSVSVNRGAPLVVAAAERVRKWAGRFDTRWARALHSLLDPTRSDARALAVLAVVLIGGAWLFLGVLQDVISGDPLVRADTAIYQGLTDLRTAPGDAVMITITELGDTVVVVAVAMAVLGWLLWKRAWRTAGYWLGATAGAMALNTAIKVALHRARPGELLYSGWSVFSFPSDHSTFNIVLYGFLAFLIARQLRPVWRVPVILTAALFVLLVAFSRLYLGAHWLSDVVGGLAFGTAWLAALGFFYLRKPSEPIPCMGLIVAGLTTLVLAGAINVHRHRAFDLQRYAITRASLTMPADIWWNTGWRQLPTRRIDLAGEAEEPLTIQWAGDLDSIQRLLVSKGWQPPPPWRPANMLAWLTANASPGALPVVPQLAGGRLPSLTLIRSSDMAPAKSRLVLRLWTVDLMLTNQPSSPVWVGTVVEERLDHPVSLVTLTLRQPDLNGPRNAMAAEVGSGRLSDPIVSDEHGGWDGRILLVRQASSSDVGR